MPAVREAEAMDLRSERTHLTPRMLFCSFTQARRLVNEASSTDKTFQLWDGAYHELFNEPESGQVLDKLCAWIADHAAKGSKL
jgi:alpha-beta hydrolase superfamily lysophospholipase